MGNMDMNIQAEHEIHQRRKGRNIGVGLLLAGMVASILALTYFKITSENFEMPPINESQ